MSAEVENLFYVSNDANQRFVPWHKLGIAVDDCLTSKEAICAAGLDWKVESKPIFDADGNIIPNFKANTRSSDKSILGIVSDKYTIVQNEDAFEFTDSLIADRNNDVKYEVAGSLRNGKAVWDNTGGWGNLRNKTNQTITETYNFSQFFSNSLLYIGFQFALLDPDSEIKYTIESVNNP